MINLLPYKEKKIIEHIRSVRMVSTVLLSFLFLALIALVLLVPTWLTTNSRLKISTDEIHSLEKRGMITSVLDLTSLQNRAVELQNKLSSTETSSPVEFISIIKSSAPKGVTISRFTTDDGILVEVFGVSESRELLQGFINTLTVNPKILMVDNPVSNFIKNKNGTFKLTVSFK